ncbi:MAG: ribose 5-phosphate isomerase B [Alteromonas naphthalenivorans]|jgi:ribose 5-phosphate isomerase B
MKIAIGTDHRGFELKNHLIQSMHIDSIVWVDVGCESANNCDFPLYAQEVAKKVQDKKVDGGVLLCGSGVGMSIAANRFKGVYAALAWNIEIAKLSKEHDNANILVLPTSYISLDDALAMIRVWYKAKFLGGRYQERLTMIDG